MDDKRLKSFARKMFDKRDENFYDLYSKALAHFMFREVVEDIHAQGKITNAEMADLNREAANRAKFFLENIAEDPAMQKAFCMDAIMCNEWDDPVITEELEERLEMYKQSVKKVDEYLKG